MSIFGNISKLVSDAKQGLASVYNASSITGAVAAVRSLITSTTTNGVTTFRGLAQAVDSMDKILGKISTDPLVVKMLSSSTKKSDVAHLEDGGSLDLGDTYRLQVIDAKAKLQQLLSLNPTDISLSDRGRALERIRVMALDTLAALERIHPDRFVSNAGQVCVPTMTPWILEGSVICYAGGNHTAAGVFGSKVSTLGAVVPTAANQYYNFDCQRLYNIKQTDGLYTWLIRAEPVIGQGTTYTVAPNVPNPVQDGQPITAAACNVGQLYARFLDANKNNVYVPISTAQDATRFPYIVSQDIPVPAGVRYFAGLAAKSYNTTALQFGVQFTLTGMPVTAVAPISSISYITVDGTETFLTPNTRWVDVYMAVLGDQTYNDPNFGLETLFNLAMHNIQSSVFNIMQVNATVFNAKTGLDYFGSLTTKFGQTVTISLCNPGSWLRTTSMILDDYNNVKKFYQVIYNSVSAFSEGINMSEEIAKRALESIAGVPQPVLQLD